jgi:hypothetical protein
MRRILVATLVAIPALVSSQASTVQPSHAPAMLLAKISAAPATPILPPVVHPTLVNVVIHQAIAADADTILSIARTPVMQSVNEVSAPQLIKTVNTELTPQQIANGSVVKVRLTVDERGVPQELAVLSATDNDIAKRTLAAVSQYRFKPATVNSAPIATAIMLSIDVR